MRSLNVYGFLLTCSFLLIIFTVAPFTIGSSDENPRSTRSVSQGANYVKYGVICDAGSSGTRIFVYTLRQRTVGLTDIDTMIHSEEPVVKKISPGLSTFGEKPEKVIEYISPLLKFAEEHIPADKIAETDLLIFATAGMRLLPETQKTAIVEHLRNGLKGVTSLRVKDSNIRIIDGAWEGIYSWIAVNYILGRFEKENDAKVGMIDMGGASVQIAFEMPKEEDFNSENVFEINLGPVEYNNDFKYKIYSTTFLGYGANEGLKRYEKSLIERGESEDSCSPRGLSRQIGARALNGSGQWDTCLAQVSSLIGDKNKPVCSEEMCFLRHVPAPSVNLSNVQLYGFSEYWYTTNNFGAGGDYDFEKFAEEVRMFCKKEWDDIQEGFKKNEFPNAEFERLETNCFKAAWVASVLHEGFNVDKKQNLFQSVLKIAGEEMQWALGAMLYHARDLKFDHDLLAEEDVFRSSQQVSNTFSLIVILIFVFLAIFIRQLQPDSTYKKYRSLRIDTKPDLFTV
ncbi:unnamed protein product [Caenorhabditis sp. 36 PRJEB53466]|nr:unnamed protein product [Caenorhabditis sp. 36 PRJEB53466]